MKKIMSVWTATMLLAMVFLLSACYRYDDIDTPRYPHGIASDLSANSVFSTTMTTGTQTTSAWSSTSPPTVTTTASQTSKTTKSTKDHGGIPVITERTTAQVTTADITSVTRRTRPSDDRVFREKIEAEWIPYYQRSIQDLQQKIGTMEKDMHTLKGYLADSKVLLQESKDHMEQAERENNGGALLAYRQSAAIRQDHVDYYTRAIDELTRAVNNGRYQLQQAESALAEYQRLLDTLPVNPTAGTASPAS